MIEGPRPQTPGRGRAVPLACTRWASQLTVGSCCARTDHPVTLALLALEPAFGAACPRVDCKPSTVPALGAPYSCLGHLGTGT